MACKNICNRFEKPKVPAQKFYDDHVWCSTCARWIKRTILITKKSKTLRCPCCNIKPQMKPKNKKFRPNERRVLMYS